MSYAWGTWLGWSSVALGFLGMFVFCWIQGSELDDLRGRVDLLEEQRGALQADLTEGLDLINGRVDALVPEPRGIEEQDAPQSASPQVNLEEPTTQPILRVPTDTVAQAAAIDRGLAAITAEVAHYGRHAHRKST